MTRTAVRGGLCALLAALSLAGCVSIPSEGPVVPGRKVGLDAKPRDIAQFPANRPTPGADPAAIVAGFVDAAKDFANDFEVARAYLTDEARTSWQTDNPVVLYRGSLPAAVQTEVDGVQVTRSPTPSTSDTAAPTSAPAAPTAGTSASSPAATKPSGSAAPSGSGTPSATASPSRSTAAPRPCADAPAASPAASGGSPSRPPGPTAARTALRPSPRGIEPTVLPPKEGQTAVVQLCIPIAGRILPDGQFAAGQPREEELRTFQLQVDRGEWRISGLTDGLIIPESFLGTLFGAVPLYFPDRTGTWLVPDVRWFPSRSSLALVVQALLDAPSSWLAGVVQTGFPIGTQLTADGVRVTATSTTVDLTQDATDATPALRRMLRAQLQETLSAAAERLGSPFPELKITVKGREFSIVDDPSARFLPAPDGPAVSTPMVVDSRGQIANLTGLTTRSVDGLPGLRALGVTFPTVSLDAAHPEYAALVGDPATGPVSLVTAEVGGDPVTRLTDGPLVPPSYDRFGFLWTARARWDGTATALHEGQLHAVAAPWLKGYTVQTMRLSREGARVVVVASRNGIGYAFVAGVVRAPDGTPTAFTQGQLLVPDLADAKDAAWVDAEQVAILGTRDGGTPRSVTRVQVGGPAESLAETVSPEAQRIAVGRLSDEVWIGTAKATLVKTPTGFQTLENVRWPTVVG